MRHKGIDSFIERSMIIHKGKYTYGSVKWKTRADPVDITCPIHGDFVQTPHWHLRGGGCPKCRLENEETSPINVFIGKAKRVHGNKYTYDNVAYVNSVTKVNITCPIHGDFEQTPAGHISGNGCPKCAEVSRKVTLLKTTKQFIVEAVAVHGDKYDYSQSVYTGSSFPIQVVCPYHGMFQVRAHVHLQGYGCPECAKADRDKHTTFHYTEAMPKREPVKLSPTMKALNTWRPTR